MFPICNELVWIGRSQRDFSSLSQQVQEEFHQDLIDVLKGRHPSNAKPLKGFGGAAILELVSSDRSGTYRVAYTIRIKGRVCVLHVFQKKSSTGIKTSKQDMDIIKQRLAQAEKEHGK